MLCCVTDAVTGAPMSLHFTEIKSDGSGKAPVEKPKRLLGGHAKKGGVIRLTDPADSNVLAIAEGVETAL